MTHHATFATPLGELTAVADDDALIGLYFEATKYRPAQSTFGAQVEAESDPVFASTRAQISEYFAGSRTEFDLPLRLQGHSIAERVWAMLLQIPYGTTTTYGQLATDLGDRNLAQLVGQAVGHNPISVVVPCHRVIGADGSLTGYAGGIERKQFLLELEEPAERKAERLF